MCLKTENGTPSGGASPYRAPPPPPELHISIGVYLPQQYGYPNERNFYHQFVNNRIGGKRIAQAVIGQYAY